MADYRMVWVRDRISKVMGVQDHPEALENLMKEHQDEFQTFLDDEVSDISGMKKCVFFIYRTFYDRLVEREVVTIEKVPRIMTPPPPPVDTISEKKGRKGKAKKSRDTREELAEVRMDPDIEDVDRETSRAVPERKKGGKSRRRRTAVEEDDEPEGETPEPPKIQEYSYIEVRKIEQSFEKTPTLNCVFGLRKFESITENCFLVYFVRKSLMPIPLIENFEDMSDISEQFIFGTMRGSFIHKLSSLTENIMRQTLDLQMRVPTTHENINIKSSHQ